MREMVIIKIKVVAALKPACLRKAVRPERMTLFSGVNIDLQYETAFLFVSDYFSPFQSDYSFSQRINYFFVVGG